jgi:hypothetical protein
VGPHFNIRPCLPINIINIQNNIRISSRRKKAEVKIGEELLKKRSFNQLSRYGGQRERWRRAIEIDMCDENARWDSTILRSIYAGASVPRFPKNSSTKTSTDPIPSIYKWLSQWWRALSSG